MKFDWDLILNVVIAVVLDKLILSSLMAKIPTLGGGADTYEGEV